MATVAETGARGVRAGCLQLDFRAMGGRQKPPEVLHLVDAVEGEEEAMRGCGRVARSFFCGLGGEENFDGEEGALAEQGDGPLVHHV